MLPHSGIQRAPVARKLNKFLDSPTVPCRVTKKRGGIYYFRRRLPPPGRPKSEKNQANLQQNHELREKASERQENSVTRDKRKAEKPKEARGEIALSLRTRRYRLAEYLAAELDRMFVAVLARAGEFVVVADIVEILKAHRDRLLAEDEATYFTSPPDTPVYADPVEAAAYGDPLCADIQHMRELAAARRDALRRRNWRSVEAEAEADALAAEHACDDDAAIPLRVGLLQNEIHRCDMALQRMGAGDGDATVASPAPKMSRPSQPSASGARLSVVAEAMCRTMARQQEWTAQTAHQARATCRLLSEVCGDQPITAYTKADLSRFQQALQDLPSRWDKDKRWRGMTAPQILEAGVPDDVPRLTPTTRRRHFSALTKLFDFAREHHGYIEANPAKGFSFPGLKKRSKKRQTWDGEPLRRLLQSPVFTGAKSSSRPSCVGTHRIRDHRFWLGL